MTNLSLLMLLCVFLNTLSVIINTVRLKRQSSEKIQGKGRYLRMSLSWDSMPEESLLEIERAAWSEIQKRRESIYGKIKERPGNRV